MGRYSIIVALFFLARYANCLSNYSFPANFSFGAGSSAYQTEGAVNDDGKVQNIWDYAIKENGSIIADNATAESADNDYDYWVFEDDLGKISYMNLSHYKISISWSRVFPPGGINDSGLLPALSQYQMRIKGLIDNGITPVVTLYHWDLPQEIQEMGGWTNSSTIDLFVEYARTIFSNLFMVPYFITFQEPKQICKSGYGDGTLAPFESQSGVLDYQCAYNVLKAHAAVYKMYQDEFAEPYGAKFSIALDGSLSEPKTDSDADQEAAERRNQFEFGLYANPIFFGDWPKVVVDRVANRSTEAGLNKSRLPEFTDQEKKDIKGSIDFLALNYYDTRIVADAKEADFGETSYDNDMRVEISADPTWNVDAAGNTIVTSAIRPYLNYIKATYNPSKIWITGNGIADNGTTHDGDRVTYLSEILSEVVDAIHEDKVNVIGYTYWSLLDSFEWIKGYRPHYGLYGVDLDFYENDTRISKRSTHYYKLLIQENKVPDPSELTTTTSTPTTTTSSTVPPSPTPKGNANSNFIASGLLNIVLAFLAIHFALHT